MKAIDDSYSYDEFEGFKPINLLEDKRIQPGEISIRVWEGVLYLSKAAVNILIGKKPYLRFLLNRETKQLLIAATAQAGSDTVKCCRYMDAGKVSCAKVAGLLSDITRYDHRTVHLIIPGTRSARAKDAVIFDLNAVQTRKTKSKK